MKLIIVRHGETEENLARIIQGHKHGHLSKQGKEQAKKLAKRLRDEKLDLILSSDLGRSSNTTGEINKYHSNVEIKFIKELREKTAGIYDGKRSEEFHKARENSGLPDEDFKPQKGENNKDVEKRIIKFIDKLLEKYPNKTILLSTHGRWIKVFIQHYFGICYSDVETDHTCVYMVELFKDKNHKIHLKNCTKHLENS